MIKYRIQDREAGNVITYELNRDELIRTLAVYKEDDGDDYDPDFYEVVAIDDGGKVIGRWNGDGDFIDGTDAAGRNFEVY